MRDAAQNFFKLEVQNLIEPIFWALGLAWLVLILTTLASVWGRKMSVAGKAFWSLVVLGLPVAGLYFYLFFCLFAADYSSLERFGLFRKNAQD